MIFVSKFEGWGNKEKEEKGGSGSPQPSSQPQPVTTVQSVGQTNKVKDLDSFIKQYQGTS